MTISGAVQCASAASPMRSAMSATATPRLVWVYTPYFFGISLGEWERRVVRPGTMSVVPCPMVSRLIFGAGFGGVTGLMIAPVRVDLVVAIGLLSFCVVALFSLVSIGHSARCHCRSTVDRRSADLPCTRSSADPQAAHRAGRAGYPRSPSRAAAQSR